LRYAFGNKALVKMLLKAGARADAKDRFGEPLLQTPVRMGNLAEIMLLIDYGADVYAVDADSNTALVQVQNLGEEKKKEVIRLLLNKGLKITQEQMEASFLRESLGSILLVEEKETFRKKLDTALNNDQPNLVTFNSLLNEAIMIGDVDSVNSLLLNTFWAKDRLQIALFQAKRKYEETGNPLYQDIGRLLLKYLKVIGAHGLVSSNGIVLPVPDEVRYVIAYWLSH
jgi:hypothetical protein